YPSDFAADTHTPRRSLLDAKSGKVSNGGEHVRRFLVSRSQSLRQLKWPMAGKHLIGCMVSGSRSPDSERWKIHGDGDLPLSFSYYVSASNDDYSSINSPFQGDHTNSNLSIVFESSSHNWVMNAPAVTTLGAAALALHYANLIIFIEKLAVAPRHICPDERDALYNMLTDRIRASLRARLRPIAKNMAASSSSSSSACDPAMAAEWSGTVQRILGWLAPLAHNMLRWQSERNFEQRNVASSGTGVLLLQTLHFADQKKSEAAIVELLVGLNYLWKAGRELDAKAKKLVSGGGKRDEFTDYYSSNRMECR
ncbi:Os12g0146500, partial [Oryza sativa Japonica Group]